MSVFKFNFNKLRQDPHPTLSFLRSGPDLLASLHHDHDEPKEEQVCKEEEEKEKGLNRNSSPSMVTSSDNEDQEDIISVNHIVNKLMILIIGFCTAPEKRQRAPSAYNRFIKEEIRRLKAENPNMAHKEAFSTAAKNRAHFPPIQYKGDGESGGQEDEKATWKSDSTHDQVKECEWLKIV